MSTRAPRVVLMATKPAVPLGVEGPITASRGGGGTGRGRERAREREREGAVGVSQGEFERKNGRV